MSHSHRSSFVLYALLMLIGQLTGCTTNPPGFTEQFEARAKRAGLVRDVVLGTTFSHIVYARTTVLSGDTAANKAVVVYLEGDGLPSIDKIHPAIDPTPKSALALGLLLKTKQSAWYLTRPCYNGRFADSGCHNSLWTSDRYSAVVVDSMVAALRSHAQSHGDPRLVLVGYSGGGVLALLMAARMPEIVGVVTVAANLDTESWAAYRRTSLVGSLNPTDSRELSIPEMHLMGSLDKSVPVASTTRYFVEHPKARKQELPDFDHRCCWEKNWPMLLDGALRQILPP